MVLCSPAPAALTYVHGRAIAREGRLATLDLPRAIEWHDRLAREMIEPA